MLNRGSWLSADSRTSRAKLATPSHVWQGGTVGRGTRYPEAEVAAPRMALAIEAVRHALRFGMSPNARDWARLALDHLEAGEVEDGRRALRIARSLCDGDTAARSLRVAADVLGPLDAD